MTSGGDTFDEAETLWDIPRPSFLRLRAVDWAASSSPGVLRTENEDSWGEAGGARFAVADGIGDHTGGRHASSMAVAKLLSVDGPVEWVDMLQRLSRSVRDQCDIDGFPEAGTTLVAVFVEANRCITVHVGDSRIYRLRDGILQQLTTDHTVGTLRRERGEAVDGERQPEDNHLISFLGSPAPIDRVDVATIVIDAGDRLLLCSDGIHGQIDSRLIADLLGSGDCRHAAQGLVAAADAAGGRGNATALVVEMGMVQ